MIGNHKCSLEMCHKPSCQLVDEQNVAQLGLAICFPRSVFSGPEMQVLEIQAPQLVCCGRQADDTNMGLLPQYCTVISNKVHTSCLALGCTHGQGRKQMIA